ncbi:unnamed protein product [Pedinophyceae sp. YPF-701]|nr:unnamed protein product [Pedinophyceae sp. YPF-701]
MGTALSRGSVRIAACCSGSLARPTARPWALFHGPFHRSGQKTLWTLAATRMSALGMSAKEGDESAGGPTGAPVAPGAADVAVPTTGPDGQPLSKNAQKKLRKQLLWEQRRKERKQHDREKKARAREAKRAARDAEFAALTEEEREERRKAAAEHRRQLRAEEDQRRARVRRSLTDGIDVCIDLDWPGLHNDRGLRSLAQQVSYCYSANSRAATPLHLHLAGLAPGSDAQSVVQRLSGVDNWCVTKHEGGVGAAFADRAGQVVYLTADAEDTLETLEKGKVYVIGGMVDRNKHKGICLERAKELGVQAAKLPIREHLAEMKGTHVLTVNHVMEMLIRYQEAGSWAEAVQAVVPTRKRKLDDEDAGSAGEGDDDGDGAGEAERRKRAAHDTD